MSLFKKIRLPCLGCEEVVEFNAVHSVNADRRPDLRDAILNGTFQFVTCKNCEIRFRLDPELTYVNFNRGQWIAAYPFGHIGDWESLEAQTRATFDRSYGPTASPAARELGTGLAPRLTFGWAALREKIFVAANNLQDIELELTKIAVLRGSDSVPLTATTELRLVEIQGDTLVMIWVVSQTSEVVETLAVPRALYDEIAADQVGWRPLREEFTGRMFVDMQRLMLPEVSTRPETVAATP